MVLYNACDATLRRWHIVNPACVCVCVFVCVCVCVCAHMCTHACESQCGFRKGRGCVDMIFVARQLVEKTSELLT